MSFLCKSSWDKGSQTICCKCKSDRQTYILLNQFDSVPLPLWTLLNLSNSLSSTKQSQSSFMVFHFIPLILSLKNEDGLSETYDYSSNSTIHVDDYQPLWEFWIPGRYARFAAFRSLWLVSCLQSCALIGWRFRLFPDTSNPLIPCCMKIIILC